MNKKGQKEGVCMEHGSGWRGRAEFDKTLICKVAADIATLSIWSR